MKLKKNKNKVNSNQWSKKKKGRLPYWMNASLIQIYFMSKTC